MPECHPSIDPQRPVRQRILLAALLLTVMSLLFTGCFTLVNGESYAIGLESNRADLVVHTKATDALHAWGVARGHSAARSILVRATPAKIPITSAQRTAICVLSVALCLSVDQIGRTLVSWFKSDVQNRDDFWQALDQAAARGRCFAWTYVPSRNLTHKAIGTSGCAKGKAP